LFESNPHTLHPQPLEVGSILESISLCISAETGNKILKHHVLITSTFIKILNRSNLLGVASSVNIEIIPRFELPLTILTIQSYSKMLSFNMLVHVGGFVAGITTI